MKTYSCSQCFNTILGIDNFKKAATCYQDKNYKGMAYEWGKGATKIAVISLFATGLLFACNAIYSDIISNMKISNAKLDEFNELYARNRHEEARAIVDKYCFENNALECKKVNEQALLLLDKIDSRDFRINAAYKYAEKCLTSTSPICHVINEKAYIHLLIKAEIALHKYDAQINFANYVTKCLEISSDTCDKINEKAYRDLIPLEFNGQKIKDYAKKCFEFKPDIFKKFYDTLLNHFLSNSNYPGPESLDCLRKENQTEKCVKWINSEYYPFKMGIWNRLFPLSENLDDKKREVLLWYIL